MRDGSGELCIIEILKAFQSFGLIRQPVITCIREERMQVRSAGGSMADLNSIIFDVLNISDEKTVLIMYFIDKLPNDFIIVRCE